MIDKLRQFSEYMSKTQSQRQEHIDLETPCIPSTAIHPQTQRRQARGSLIKHLGLVGTQYSSTQLDMQCCHLCPNNSGNKTYGIPLCINPHHMYLGTYDENINDRNPHRQVRGFSA